MWSTNSRNSTAASARITPPPAWITGFFASASVRTIRSAVSSSIDGLCSVFV